MIEAAWSCVMAQRLHKHVKYRGWTKVKRMGDHTADERMSWPSQTDSWHELISTGYVCYSHELHFRSRSVPLSSCFSLSTLNIWRFSFRKLQHWYLNGLFRFTRMQQMNTGLDGGKNRWPGPLWSQQEVIMSFINTGSDAQSPSQPLRCRGTAGVHPKP